MTKYLGFLFVEGRVGAQTLLPLAIMPVYTLQISLLVPNVKKGLFPHPLQLGAQPLAL